jgi:ABC-2 type transport system ATP-binding protein
MLHLQNVSVTIDGTPVLRGVTFTANAGQVTGYVGPNGAGKTTTMRLLTGVLKPSAGRVLLAGIDVATNPLAAKRSFGYVPEAGQLYDSFTAAEYLAFIGRMHGLDEQLIRDRTKALFRFWGLEKAAHQRMHGFSKGMKQKVLLSAGLLHDPPVFLLDEPLNGLDAHAVLQVRALLRTRAAAGRTVFYSSHILDAVEKVADRVVVIRDGQIVTVGSPQEIVTAAAAGSLEDAFSHLTSTADALDEAEILERDAFGREPIVAPTLAPGPPPLDA